MTPREYYDANVELVSRLNQYPSPKAFADFAAQCFAAQEVPARRGSHKVEEANRELPGRRGKMGNANPTPHTFKGKGAMSEQQPEIIEADLVTRLPVPRAVDAITEFGIEDVGDRRALKVANALASLVQGQNLSVRIGNGNHWRVEAWCAAGSMVGVTPRTEWVEELRNPQTGAFEGAKAAVEVIQISTGQVIGRAIAVCYADEATKRRDGSYYERWMEDGRPQRHAIVSMCQTRATSKALGQVLRFLAVMAGYSGTPAEEMTHMQENGGGNGGAAQSARPSQASASPPAPGIDLSVIPDFNESEPLATKAQLSPLWKAGFDTAERLKIDDKWGPTNELCELVGVSKVSEIRPSMIPWCVAYLNSLTPKNITPGAPNQAQIDDSFVSDDEPPPFD